MPSCSWRAFYRTDPEYVYFLNQTSSLRNELQQNIDSRKTKLAGKRTASNRENYDYEARRYSAKFRRVIAPIHHEQTPPLKSDDGNIPNDKQEESNVYLSHWEKLGEASDKVQENILDQWNRDFPIDKAKEDLTRGVVRSFEGTLLDPPSYEEIMHELQRPNTAPGPDNVTYSAIRFAFSPPSEEDKKWAKVLSPKEWSNLHTTTEVIRKNITAIITWSIVHSSIVPALLRGEICPLPKCKNPSSCNDLRGITLLSCIYKLITAIINKRLLGKLEQHGLITSI